MEEMGDKELGIERRDRRNEWDGDDRDKGKGRREEGQRRNDRFESNGRSSRSRQGRSASPPDRHQRKQRSLSPDIAADRKEAKNANRDDQGDDEDDSMAKMKAAEKALEEKQEQQPSFELSGKLAAETNRVRGIALLFNEPPEARKPYIRWRLLYVFKGGEALNEPLYIHRQSCYLSGREMRIADVPMDHPSCSKKHAVIQFRQVEKEQPDVMMKKQIRPYLMDLGSTNKTYLNYLLFDCIFFRDNAIEPQRYYELFEKDTIKFGNSSWDYVLLHENSAG
ncbi:hypothetical protein MLD38_017949 [Melastoma candidum]|uniref:Uncharacterized protein n=1 Tax=Melastoma candidum TaxID=119954 RepID=A0ACB9QVE8_9MYRT|nr:hypothetical protein MLD38_017949 [Melastoma candidum]